LHELIDITLKKTEKFDKNIQEDLKSFNFEGQVYDNYIPFYTSILDIQSKSNISIVELSIGIDIL